MQDTLLWVAQGMVAVLVAITGTVKLVLPKERLAQRMHWASSWPAWRIKLLGAAEVAGAIGLIVPLATGILPLLTPIAAACLAVLMIGAVETHRRMNEGFAPALVTAVLCVVIAIGRFASVTAA